ncbi:MAG: ATP-dependent Clp protease, protease subunit [Parcubacteria group bacterium Gr01-1014_48]|nr:MAG: ATP-dependent Clp protease, protease subunit [Parcubacteria group bacterium Greene0416_14]TSC73596.1 MAG: ATP-dependent Clp protease, protease subunit [Parcubacteria group bacterium Gr01-1014_48]TSD00969.1 MAG: ATP-dependent Clp protease, protease subunit [Parcubacteria group bacterium Greene1014_15]TSD07541.1 MAG: ATP-dependent Clp protease, protease subunit [Parcubacteria group bacterium Greene0714_4]
MLTGIRRLNWLGPCTDELFEDMYQQLMVFLEGDRKIPDEKISADTESPILLYIMSPGGDIAPTFAWYDLLNYALNPRPNIHALGTGIVASAAILALLSVPKKHRFITPNTLIHLHQMNMSLSEGKHTQTDISEMNKCFDWDSIKYYEIIASQTKLSLKRIKEMCRDGTVITPEDAKRLGFVHDILPVKHR